MNKPVINTESIRANLTEELQLLRKGSGIQPWKLQHMKALRCSVAQQLGIDPASLSMSQTHAKLLHELSELGDGDMANALRNAYAIGQETHPRSLTARRHNFALQVQRHPDTVKAYENQAIAQLAHHLLHKNIRSAHLAQHPKDGPVPDYNTVTVALQRSVAEGLAGLYGLGIHSGEVLGILGRNRYPYINADITSTLLPSSRGHNWYAYDFKYTFHFAKSVFRVGLVTSIPDSGILIGSGLFDEITCVASDDFESEIAKILESWHFTVNCSNGREVELEFAEIDAYSRHQLLEGIWQVDANNCRVIEVAIPPELIPESTSYTLKTTTHLPLGQYAYWESPGLMYVNTITFDVRKFPGYENWDFLLQPFLGTAFSGKVEPHEGKFILPANSWITHGHGVLVAWQKKATSEEAQ